MPTSEDVLVYFKGVDQVSSTTQGILSKTGALKAGMGAALTAAGAGLASFGKSAITDAVSAESKWNQFSSALSNQGINWSTQGDNIKQYMQTFSDSMGRTVGDTRDASSALMKYGLSWNDTKSAMSGVAGLAAMTGSSEADASKMVISALAGRGMAFEKATGLELDNYKAADGTIDRAKLFHDLSNKTKPFAMKFAGSSEAQLNKMEGALKGVKIAIGQGLLAAITPLVPLITTLARAFSSLPGPIKALVSGAVLIGAGFGLIVGPLQATLGILEVMGITLPTLTGEFGLMASVKAALSGAAAADMNATIGEAAAHASTVAPIFKEEGGLIAVISAKISHAAAAASDTIASIANSVALLAGADASVVAAAANAGLTASLWAMTAALLANPITWIIIALVALVVIVYEVGKAFGWWNSVSDVLAAVTSGVQRLWNAFMNDPNVKAVVAGLTSVWNGLMQVLSPLISLGKQVWKAIFPETGSAGNFDIVSSIIGFFGSISNIISGAGKAIANFPSFIASLPGKVAQILVETVVKIVLFGAQIANTAKTLGVNFINYIVNGLTGLGGKIWNALVGAVTQFVKFNTQVRATVLTIGSMVVSGIVNSLLGLGGKIWGALVGAVNQFVKFNTEVRSKMLTVGSQVVSAIINGLTTLPGKIWAVLVNAMTQYTKFITQTVNNMKGMGTNVVNAIVNGLKTLPTKIWSALMTAITRFAQFDTQIRTKAKTIGLNILNGVINNVKTLPAKLWNYLLQTITRILHFGNTSKVDAVKVGMNILNGILQFIKQLPNQIANWFNQTVARIVNFAGQALANARTVGQSAVTGVITYVSQIPQKVYNEFIKIGQKIKDSVSSAVSAATSFGGDIVNAVMGALHIASPGIIQRNIAKEFADISGRIGESNDSASTAAGKFGKDIVTAFGKPKLSVGTDFKMGNDSARALNDYQAQLQNKVKAKTRAMNMLSGGVKAVGGTQITNKHINMGEGSMQIDARNMTAQEAQQVVITAFEEMGKK